MFICLKGIKLCDMKIKKNVPIYNICWLSHLKGGLISTFYEPETIEELVELCSDFYAKNLDFDIIGHTSNTLYTESYNCNRMVSTRKLTFFEIKDDFIYSQCGVSVKKLSMDAVDKGIKGFEGLVSLPGTVAAALYGHATCYNCDLSRLLIEATVLLPTCEVKTVGPEWFCFQRRSSCLKRKENNAIILTLNLRRVNGDPEELKRIAELNVKNRQETQPEPKDGLGSIFADEGRPTYFHYSILIILRVYAIFLSLIGNSKEQIIVKRKHAFFKLLGATELEPYVPYWNWYQWKDERAHMLFWKFVELHKKLYTRTKFEIEIK